MSMQAQPTGGFLGDPAEALSPPASAGGCCGGPATTELTQVSTCRGSASGATAEDTCCGTEATEQAVAPGARCCG